MFGGANLLLDAKNNSLGRKNGNFGNLPKKNHKITNYWAGGNCPLAPPVSYATVLIVFSKMLLYFYSIFEITIIDGLFRVTDEARPTQKSWMMLFAEIVDGFNPLIISPKTYILDV